MLCSKKSVLGTNQPTEGTSTAHVALPEIISSCFHLFQTLDLDSSETSPLQANPNY